MTGPQLAKAAGVSQSMVSRLESAKFQAPLDAIKKIEATMVLPLGYLFRAVGSVENGDPVDNAIAAAKNLQPDEKEHLLTAYRGLLAVREARGRPAAQ